MGLFGTAGRRRFDDPQWRDDGILRYRASIDGQLGAAQFAAIA